MFTRQKSWILQALQDLTVAGLIMLGVARPIFSAEKWEVTEYVLALAALLSLSMFIRRRLPVAVLILSIGLSVLLMAAEVSGPVVGLAPALALFASSRALTTKGFLLVSTFSITVLASTFMLFFPFDLSDPALFAFAALQVTAVATAIAAKSRRENIELLELRAIEAEESKESEAKTRVGAERLRIARDLHDLIGHQLAATSLHAEVAERMVEINQEAALESLGAIKRSARQSLGDLAQMLRVLRDDDGLESLASIENVSSLIESHREYGLEVIEQFEADLEGLGASTQLVFYRCLQESLANAGKYANPKSVTIRVQRNPHVIRISITNRFNPMETKPLSAGYGLIGLRERVESVAGDVQVRQQNERFELRISLPITGVA